MIKMIDIDLIHAHPDNPRKTIRDIEEISDSIKENGILQNLTVVPWLSVRNRREETAEGEMEGEYTVVIGHRRLAAAKRAGLQEVPCTISDMDYKTQVGIMLVENMQRDDLTEYEQAQGFQMMLDLGDTINDISVRTGFSERTVQRRVKMLELDQEKFKESVERGATLTDLAELSKIKDIKKRNQILEYAGTSDFNWRLSGALNDQESREVKKKLIEIVSQFATDIKKVDKEELKTKRITFLSYNPSSLDKEIEIEEGKDYVYEVEKHFINIYENTFGQPETEEEIRRREELEAEKAREDERKVKQTEIKERTEKLREDFISSLTNTKLMKHIGEILLLGTQSRASLHMWRDSSYIEVFNLDIEEDDFDFRHLEEDYIKRPALTLLKIIYHGKLSKLSYFNWTGGYSRDRLLDMLYDILQKVGYEMSEEEKEIQDGSHEIFKELES